MSRLLQAIFPTRSRPANPELESFLCGLADQPEFRSLCAEINKREELRAITGADEMATISYLVRRLRPAMCLEIGTFFAGTSRVIAEALAEVGSGQFLTVDPYGGHRVPDIIAGWPEACRKVVEFRAVNSMDVFSQLEMSGLPRGGQSPLSLVFVDGNHNFEYALFDIIRSADLLTPGGAIVVDNMEQQGPRQAAYRFLQWNPAWRLFANGRIFDGEVRYDVLARHLDQLTSSWGVLIAPRGIQISTMAFKSFERNVRYQPIRAIKLNLIEVSRPGTVTLNLNYHAYPFDYHITGTGMAQQVRRVEVQARPGSAAVAELNPPAELQFPHPEYNTNRELEVLFAPHGGGSGHLLLDKDQPFIWE